MITRRITYIVLFVFFTWLALATRHHSDWFFPVVAKYGGDVIWAGMFFFAACYFSAYKTGKACGLQLPVWRAR